MIDSNTQMTTVTPASSSSWDQRSSIPNQSDTSDWLPRTTTSTATPISSSGSTSKNLLSTDRTVPTITARWSAWAKFHSRRRGWEPLGATPGEVSPG